MTPKNLSISTIISVIIAQIIVIFMFGPTLGYTKIISWSLLLSFIIGIIYFFAKLVWYGKVKSLSKTKSYWIPKLFVFYLINGGFVIYNLFVHDFDKPTIIFLFILGIIGFIYELAFHSSTKNSIIDMNKTRAYCKQKGIDYSYIALAGVAIYVSMVMIAIMDGVFFVLGIASLF